MSGSIPACAGEPPPPRRQCPPSRVYPRVCGGTRDAYAPLIPHEGLSPRVRGNRALGGHHRQAVRSIPACAGEPTAEWHLHWWNRVYPRVCGGTFYTRRDRPTGVGLSPRVRGNLIDGGEVAYWEGSIPACAGEPTEDSYYAWAAWVYPRVCGGTESMLRPPLRLLGLSPRVRGNHGYVMLCPSSGGSIPACAGEPARIDTCRRFIRVYPRVCGGTAWPRVALLPRVGLSPRVRGNPG